MTSWFKDGGDDVTGERCCHLLSAHAAHGRRLCRSVCQFLAYSTFVVVCVLSKVYFQCTKSDCAAYMALVPESGDELSRCSRNYYWRVISSLVWHDDSCRHVWLCRGYNRVVATSELHGKCHYCSSLDCRVSGCGSGTLLRTPGQRSQRRSNRRVVWRSRCKLWRPEWDVMGPELGWKNLSCFVRIFKTFLGFSVQRRADTKLRQKSVF